MYFIQDKITEIFYLTDEFCTEFQDIYLEIRQRKNQ